MSQGAYVGQEWVEVSEAKRLLTPDTDGPGAYAGRTWVAFTCKQCGNTPSRCSHKKARTVLHDGPSAHGDGRWCAPDEACVRCNP